MSDADRHFQLCPARRMTGGELTLGALLVRLEERQREIAAQAEAAREKIAELTALLDGLDTAAEEIRITRKTLLELPDPEAPVPPAAQLPGPSCARAVVGRSDDQSTPSRSATRVPSCSSVP
ncbi:hypothetical protein [Streptomyces sp. NPDC101234]|uniref:hypothetical protein n=1 Tax=Streptomyces sp. NPDC101234 TaxID=3366138 RepID=UPI0037FBDE39